MSAAEDRSLFDVKLETAEMGRPDSLRRHILTWVLEERYDKAIGGLREFLEAESIYPNFRPRVERYISHSIDLIYAIKAKRSFPGINSLTRAKQQELREKFKDHFRELQHMLKTIEKVQFDLRLQDVRSTVYVVKALWIAGIAVILLAFWIDFVHGIAGAGLHVVDDALVHLTDWLWKLIGL